MGNSRSRSASSKETGHDRKGRGATFSGTTKEATPPTESVEKQVEAKNTATSQESLRPVDVAVKESTSQQLGGQIAGADDEASQSQLCEPFASDDAETFNTGTSPTGGGVADKESSSAAVSTKKTNKDGVQQSTDATQQIGSSITSVEKQIEVVNISGTADVTNKETVHALSPLLGDSQTISGQPKLRINPSTGGKLVSASAGANSDQISHSHQVGSSVCLRTSSSTAQLSVLSAEAANSKLETKVNEVNPGAMRLSDVRSLSQVDSLQATMTKPSTDGTKPSPSTDTSTGGVSSEQGMEGSHRSGTEVGNFVAMGHTHSIDDQLKLQETQSVELLQVSASAKTDKLDVKLTEEEVAQLLEMIHTFSSKWGMIGLKIGFTSSELEHIKSMPLLLATAPTSYLKELLSQWVQWPTLRHPTQPTLRVLCTSLRSALVGLGALADEVEREMKQAITVVGYEVSGCVAVGHTHSTDDDQLKLQGTRSRELQVSVMATGDKLDVKLTEKDVDKLLELIYSATFGSKWELIGLLLGFAPSELENIIESMLNSTHTYYRNLKDLLSRWVQWPNKNHPTRPTLRALCTSLRSSIIGLGIKADKVEREMKPQAITVPPVADQGHKDDTAIALKKFENRFYDLHTRIREELLASCMDTSKILNTLTLLPPRLKMVYDKPIREQLLELKQQKSINELLYYLNPLLSYIDYDLLDHIIEKLGSDELKEDFAAYCSDIQLFMQKTTIQQLIDHLPGQPKVPPNFELLKAKLDKDAKEYSMAELSSLRTRFCAEIKLSEIVFHFIALENSRSFIVFFIVPSVLLPDVIESIRKLDNSFFRRESIAFFYIRNRWLYSPKLLRFGAQLRERYQQSLVSVSPSELIPLPTKKIFRLAMIQRERVQQGKIKEAFVRMSISGKVDDIMRAKIPVELKDILRSTFHGGEIVLVEGAPGSGKSTLTIHICKKWGRGELFEQFSVVILVQLRDPAVQRAKSIADLLPCQDVAVAQEYASEIIATNGRGILWVLDGWDELPPHLQQHSIFRSFLPPPPIDQQLQQIKQDPQHHKQAEHCSTNEQAYNPSFYFNQRYLNESSVIVTSRPISSGDLHPVVSSRIEVLGFTPEEQRQYFTECLKGDSQALGALLQKIKENPVVQSICYLPLNAAFVVHTFKYKGQSLPSTVYEIYLSVITSIVSRHFSREGKGHNLPGELASLADLSRSRVAGKDFQRLCEMAHHGVMQNKVTFSSSEFPEGSTTLSLLQGIESFLEGGKSVFYNFLHLIIQEIMSAYHIATQLSDSEQVSQFQQLFNQPRFAAVFQFYSAITKLETPGIRDVVARMVSEEAGMSLLVPLLRCLYEAQDPLLCLYVAEQLKYSLNLYDTSLSPLDCLSLSFFFSVVNNYCKEIYVSIWNCHIDDLGVNCLTKYLSSNIDHGGKMTLDLTDNNINEEGASYIAKMLCSSNIVEHLYLSHNPIGDTGASFISNAVRETTSLKTLNLFKCGITSQGAEELSRALAQNSSLEKLDIGDNELVGDEGIRLIAEALEHNKQLKELWIGECGVTDKGAAYLASALSVNSTLKVLRMGDGGGKLIRLSEIMQTLSHNTGLIELVVPVDLSSITEHYEQKLNETRKKVGLPPIKIYASIL